MNGDSNCNLKTKEALYLEIELIDFAILIISFSTGLTLRNKDAFNLFGLTVFIIISYILFYLPTQQKDQNFFFLNFIEINSLKKIQIIFI